MKKKFRAKVSGVFDIVQLSDTTFSGKSFLERPYDASFKR